MVLDTDTYNEVDDQFALAYALRSPEKLDVEAVYAAPFHNHRSSSPQDGMEKSYDEIVNILSKLDISPDRFSFRGSKMYLPSLSSPVESEAVDDLIQRALAKPDEPLYVVAIGAITNIASALLLKPEIIKNIVVVWLGGHALHWPHNKEFNLYQDVLSARVVFDCGVPLVHIPCQGVTSHLHTTIPELEYYLKGKSEIADYLVDIVREYTNEPYAWSKVIWDVAAIAWLIDPDSVWTHLISSPVPTDQLTWSVDNRRHQIRYAFYINRNRIYRDLFEKLSK